MVAHLKPVPARLELLCEPDPPTPGVLHAPGWLRGTDGEWVRNPAWDHQGALVQHAIVRYYVHGASRATLAAELTLSERQVQAWLLGGAMAVYGQPVRRVLAMGGISLSRGGTGLSDAGARRNREIINACMYVLELVAEFPTVDARLRDLARLYSAGREPLG